MGNVPYFATRLDEISSDRYIPTDSDILHANIGSTVRGLAVFEIDSIRHRVWDSTKTPPRRVSETITEFSYVIYTASLIDYRSSAVNDSRVTSMSTSMEVFEALCNDSDAPIVLLFTKLDILYDTIVRYPIRNYYRDASKDMTCHQACDFFADQFRSRDRRPYGELHIYFVDATDTEDFKSIMRDVRENMCAPLWPPSRASVCLTAPDKQRVYRRQSLTDDPPLPRMVKEWKLGWGGSRNVTSHETE